LVMCIVPDRVTPGVGKLFKVEGWMSARWTCCRPDQLHRFSAVH